MLDLQTISRISRVSVQGLTVVQSLPAYQELLEHVPCVVAVLSQTKLLSLHSMIQLRGVLRSDRCECCPEYGAYLFLPTCVRCCWECLNINPSLRAISLKDAKKYFGLKERHLKQLPVLHTIPGNYIFTENTQVSSSLISAVAAKELGIMVHGSAENLANSLVRRFKAAKSITIGRFLQRASATPLGEDPLAGPCQGNIPPYDFFGMASIPIPSLQAPGIVEDGLWCKGCRYTFELHGSGRLDPVVLSWIIPPEWDPYRVLHGMSRRARSKTGFLEHTRHCYGAQELIRDSARDE